MNTLYTPEVYKIVHSYEYPKSLTWEVREYEYDLKFTMFRDNINALSGEDKLLLANTLNAMLWAVRDTGIPMYTAVEPGDGR